MKLDESAMAAVWALYAVRSRFPEDVEVDPTEESFPPGAVDGHREAFARCVADYAAVLRSIEQGGGPLRIQTSFGPVEVSLSAALGTVGAEVSFVPPDDE